MLSEAQALNVNYCQTAAAEWAKAHWDDYNSVLYNKGYWDDGGDCANFVSQCLYMGGLDMSSFWNISGYFCHWSESEGNTYAGSYVRCQQLYNFLVKQGATVINNPSASQVSIGDVILYSREGASRMTHSAIVIDIKNGEPVLAAHSTGTVRYRTDDPYQDWHLGFKPERTYLMKLNGTTCVNYNAKSFDVYVATGSNTRLYKSKSTSSGYYSTFITGSNPDYAHVYKVEDGWGYTYRYNNWGWIKLSSFTYSGHWESPAVDHVFGDWTTVTVADCKNDGVEKRTCTRCGYEETRTTKGGHIIDPTATCLSAGFCKVCKERLEEPLGHDWDNGTVTTQPTCTEKGVKTYVCKRDSSHKYTEDVAALGHNYEISPTAPTCTSHGESIYTCSRCGDSYVGDFNEENAWSGWTTDATLASQLSSDRIQTKTQYSYSDKQTTTSYSSSMDGWTQNGGSWVQQSTNSFNYASFPSGFDTSNSIYTSFHKSCDVSAYETTTNKRTVSTSSAGYVYWHWMYDTANANGSQYRSIYNQYGYGPANGYLYKYFGAFTSTNGSYSSSTTYCEDLGITNYIIPERTSWSDCQGATRWFRFNYYTATYTDYAKLFNYWKWGEYSDWQDAYVAKTDTRDVKTRTLYNYNLSALGHDFQDTDDKEYINTNTFNAPNPCYVAGGQICSRCKLRVDPDETVNHSYPVFNKDNPSSEWKLISENDNIKVYRAYCRNGCGCYIEETTVDCVWKKTVVAPTCTEYGYTLNECTTCETAHSYESDIISALGHDDSEHLKCSVYINATCTTDGVFRHYCVRYDSCGYYDDEIIPALGHEMIKHEAVPATCTEDGNTEYYQCDVCKKYYADEKGETEIEQDSWIIPAYGHVDPSTVEWVINDPNGCGITGWQKKYCDNYNEKTGEVCGFVIDEEEIPEIKPKYHVVRSENAVLVSGDEYDGVWEPTSCLYDGIIYWTCELCEGTDKAHSRLIFVTEEPDIIGRLDHIENKTIIKEAYCIYPGQYEINCTRCETLIEEGSIDAPCDEHSLDQIKADGGCVYKKCTNAPCDYIEPGEHDFQRDTARDVAATCLENGIEAYTCTKCGD